MLTNLCFTLILSFYTSTFLTYICLFIKWTQMLRRLHYLFTRIVRLFFILQTFLLLFYICLKPRLFCISHHKTTSEHHKNFDSILQKEFCDSRQKWEKRLHPVGSSVPGQAYGLRYFAKFSDFFETQCWQLCRSLFMHEVWVLSEVFTPNSI